MIADVECQLDETNTFIPILICYAQRYDLSPLGRDCIKQCIKTMLEWAKPKKEGQERNKLHTFFHNLKGFDGSFVIQ